MWLIPKLCGESGEEAEKQSRHIPYRLGYPGKVSIKPILFWKAYVTRRFSGIGDLLLGIAHGTGDQTFT